MRIKPKDRRKTVKKRRSSRSSRTEVNEDDGTQIERRNLKDGTQIERKDRRRRKNTLLSRHSNDTPETLAQMREFCLETVNMGVEGLIRDFSELKMNSKPGSEIVKTAFDGNGDKNRYKDVYCLDETRVILKSDGSDYVHANWVNVSDVRHRFICTQAPKENTTLDFWRLVVQEKVKAIVMLCNVIECGRKKCEQYWPEKYQDEMVYESIRVKNNGVTQPEHMLMVSKLELICDGDTSMVEHIFWTNWPDRGVPTNFLACFRLLARIKTYTPVLIHCSAGIGRTGTIVGLEIAQHEFQAGRKVQMKEVVRELREQRHGSVQTDIQYVYMHRCIIGLSENKKAVKRDEVAGFMQQFDDFVKKRGEMMDEVEVALNATDQFFEAIQQNDDRLNDPKFMSYLMQLRQEHKRTFSVIQELFQMPEHQCNHMDEGFNNDCCKYETSEEHDDDDDDASNDSNSNGYQNNNGNSKFSNMVVHKTEQQLLPLKRSQSMQSMLHRCECWHEEQSVNYMEEFSPDYNQQYEVKYSISSKKPHRAKYSRMVVKQMIEKKQKDQLDESEQIRALRFKARQVPASTKKPIYQQMRKNEELAKTERYDKAERRLTAMRCDVVASMSRDASDCRYSTTRRHRCLSAEASELQAGKQFRANQVPISVYCAPHRDQLLQLERARNRAERAVQLICSSKGPARLEEHSIRSRVRHQLRHQEHCVRNEPKKRQRVARTVPNFGKLHQRLNEKLEKSAAQRPVTIAVPFCFQTESRIRHHQCSQELPQSNLKQRSFSVGNLREEPNNSPNVRLNQASVLRNEAIRNRKQKFESERKNSEKFWSAMRERSEVAKFRLKQKLSAEISCLQEIRKKLLEKREEQKSRVSQYQSELEAMKRRVMSRALVVEQQDMLIQKQRFERKYQQTMAAVDQKSFPAKQFHRSKTMNNNFIHRAASPNRQQQQNLICEFRKDWDGNEVMSGDEANGSFSTVSSSSTDEDDFDDCSGASKNSAQSDDELSKITELTEKSSLV